MNAGSLFTGIGGLDIGVGVPPAWFCEYDKHCRTVLERHWPGVPVYPDVRELDASAPRVDVLHGGYPCQPFSVAGKREGENDPRHLWPEFSRLIRVLRPRVVVAENVAGHLRLGFHAVLADLAGLGMDVRWGVVRASDVGAPHRRARLFIVATHADSGRSGQSAIREFERRRPVVADLASAHPHGRRIDAEHGGHVGLSDACWGAYAPAISRWEQTVGEAPRPTNERGSLMPEFVEWMMGFPVGWTDGLARTHRLRMLGNAVVPQQARLALELLVLAHITQEVAA